MKRGIQQFTGCIVFWVAALLAVSTPAALIIDEPFTAPVDGRPAGWTWVENARTEPLIVQGVGEDERNALRVSRESHLFYEPSGGADPASDMLTNFSGSMIINTGNLLTMDRRSAVGVAVRFNRIDAEGSNDPEVSVPGTPGDPGYAILLSAQRYEPFNPYLGIWHGAQNSTHRTADESRRHLDTIQWLDRDLIHDNTDYRLDFFVNGLNIGASLYTTDAEPVLVGSTSYVIGSHSLDPNSGSINAGYFGVLGENGTDGRLGYISNLTVIPEPGTLALGLVAFGWLVALRRRFTPTA